MVGAQRFVSERRTACLKLENVELERISVIDLNHYMMHGLKQNFFKHQNFGFNFVYTIYDSNLSLKPDIAAI